MKKIFLICAAAFALGACSDEKFAAAPAPGDECVRVDFRMDADLDTDTSLRPMSRAMTSYTNFMSNTIRILLLRKMDTRWIVEGVEEVRIDPKRKPGDELRLESAGLPYTAFGVELRPGDYRAVAVLNAKVVRWNDDLVAGTVVHDTADPSLDVPPLVTYLISTHPANTGYRMLNREVFVAVADFTVPKSEDLHGTGMPPVGLHAERRVGKFRILLKDVPSPVNGYTFTTTAYTARMVFAFDGPFPVGIDALGGTCYSDQTELPWCMSTVGNFHRSGDAEYQLCQTNSTVFSPFLFLDPLRDSRTVTVTFKAISGPSGGISFNTAESFRRTFAVNKTTGIVFRPADDVDESSGQVVIGVAEAIGADGAPEDAAALFDSYYEWNAMSD